MALREVERRVFPTTYLFHWKDSDLERYQKSDVVEEDQGLQLQQAQTEEVKENRQGMVYGSFFASRVASRFEPPLNKNALIGSRSASGSLVIGKPERIPYMLR